MSLSPIAHTFNEVVPTPDLKLYLGSKGAGLNTMYRMGVPVPPGFTIPTPFCETYQNRNKLTIRMERAVEASLHWVEMQMGRRFGSSTEVPLLLSVRSGAPVSMPGMMDTVLNLGMNKLTVESLSDNIGRSFALDSYRRFLTLYSSVISGEKADERIAKLNHAYEILFKGAPDQLKERAMDELIEQILSMSNIPSDPHEQLVRAILAVFRSWNTDRAVQYRKIEEISDDLGTAVNVQAMVYGNMNEKSGTGVMFTLNPNDGKDEAYGDFLPEAQGEDVVSGAYKTLPLADMQAWNSDVYSQLMQIAYAKLESYYRDMLDIEFTVENGRLFILQSRVGKRTGIAAPAISSALYDRGVISLNEMKSRNLISVLANEEVKTEDDFEGWDLVGSGVAACPGIVSGKVLINVENVLSNDDKGYILVRNLTEPNDVPYMKPAAGIITLQGGVVSHAAVVARSWNKPCIVSADGAIGFSEYIINGHSFEEGDLIKIDGVTGNIYRKAS